MFNPLNFLSHFTRLFFVFVRARLIVLLLLLLPSIATCASAYGDNYGHAEANVSFFLTNEYQGNDSLSGFGVATLLKSAETNLGVMVLSSLSSAEVEDLQGFEQHYLAWEFGVKFGYFSNIFIYAELGVDLGEMILQDRDEDDRHYRYDDEDEIVFDLRSQRHDDQNDIDTYVGVGVGINFGHVQIEGFSRYRHIDGEFWHAEHQFYSGLKASISF